GGGAEWDRARGPHQGRPGFANVLSLESHHGYLEEDITGGVESGRLDVDDDDPLCAEQGHEPSSRLLKKPECCVARSLSVPWRPCRGTTGSSPRGPCDRPRCSARRPGIARLGRTPARA